MDRPGFIYAIRKRGGLTKIGTTKHFADRMAALLECEPEQAFIVAYYIPQDALRVERLWHEQFADKRMRGEWFQLDDGDIEHFLTCARWGGPEYEPPNPDHNEADWYTEAECAALLQGEVNADALVPTV